jgi:hypothetical protein
VRGEIRGDGLGLGGYSTAPVLEMGEIAEVGGASIGREAFANEVGNALGRGFAVNCKRTGGRIQGIFDSW